LSRFKELSQNKTTIMQRLISNENIVKALVNTNADFINTPLPSDFDASSLIRTQIYPRRFIPETTTEQKTFITMKFSGFRMVNASIKTGRIIFYVFTHSNLLPTDYGDRVDYIIGEIDTMFNDERGVGLGKMYLSNMEEFEINSFFLGSMLEYKENNGL
jgi:hypothetical protein